MFLTSDGGRDTGASFYIWITVGQGSTVVAVGAVELFG